MAALGTIATTRLGRTALTLDGQLSRRFVYGAGLFPQARVDAFSDPVAEGAGLVWMGVRAYTPKLARFTTPDPVGLAAGWNEHDALAGDPVNLIDADGLFFSRNEIADAFAGADDALLSTFCSFQCNPGSWLRDQLGIDDKVDECSPAHNGSSTVTSAAAPIPGPGKLKGISKVVGAVEDGGRAAKKSQSAGKTAGLDRQIADHEKKLDDYRRDPDASDDRGHCGTLATTKQA